MSQTNFVPVIASDTAFPGWFERARQQVPAYEAESWYLCVSLLKRCAQRVPSITADEARLRFNQPELLPPLPFGLRGNAARFEELCNREQLRVFNRNLDRVFNLSVLLDVLDDWGAIWTQRRVGQTYKHIVIGAVAKEENVLGVMGGYAAYFDPVERLTGILPVDELTVSVQRRHSVLIVSRQLRDAINF